MAYAAAILFAAQANSQVMANKSFTPANVVVGQPTTLTITILNNSTTPATGVAVTDNFPLTPSGLSVTPVGLISNTCGGTVSAPGGATSISLAGGSLPAAVSGIAGSCSFAVQVFARPATAPETYVNTIPAANISSNLGPGSSAVNATLAVGSAAPISGNKTFSPVPLQGNGSVSRMTIQLNNANTFALTGTAFTDTFPVQMQLAPVPNAVSTCGGTLTAAASALSLSLANGTIPAGSNCTIAVDMVARNSNTVAFNAVSTNSIAANSISTTQTIRNAAAVAGGVTVQKGAAVTKAFSPSTISAGSTSTLTLTLFNRNATAITGINFTDAMPAGVTVVGGASTTCGGTASFIASELRLNGGGLAGAPLGGTSSCTLTATVTASSAGSYVNSVTAGSIGGVAFPAATATLTVVTGASLTKAFNPTAILPGQTSQLTVTIGNRTVNPITGFSLTDNLPSGLTTSGAATTTCSGATATSNATSATVTGANLPAGSTTTPTTCVLRVNVTGTIPNAYVNTIPAGSISGIAFPAASATLTIRAITMTKAFSPTVIPQSGTSMLTVTLSNQSTTSSAAVTSLTDDFLATMGAGFSVAPSPAPATTCSGGVIAASPGATSFSMSGGIIPVAPSSSTPGTCTVIIPVLAGSSAPIATRTNTIAAGALVTSLGNNSVSVAANLQVTAGITASKAFLPATVGAGGTTRLTITLNKVANAGLFTNLAVTDPLPAGFTIAAVPNPATSCSGGTVNATVGATSFNLSGASLGTSTAAASCTVSVNVLAPNTLGTFTNSIPVGNANASTIGGTISNRTAVNANIQVISSVTINKTFSPTNIVPNGISTLTIYFANNASTALNLTGVTFTDLFPAGMEIATVPNAAFTSLSGTCSGTISAVPGASSVGFSTGTLGMGSACELTVDVTSQSIGTMTNQVPPGSISSVQGISNTNTSVATLVSSGTSDVEVTKTNGAGAQTAGLSTTYTLVVTNNSASLSVAGVPVNDPEPAGMTFSSWTCVATGSSSCAAASGSGSIATSVTLAPLGSATYTVNALLASNVTAPTVANTASVDPLSVGINDTALSNNTAIDTDTVNRSSDLSVTKTANSASPIVGNTVTFTITAENIGPSLASTVEVSDALPAGYTLVSATPSLGTYTAPDWTIGDLDAAQSATLAIVATVNAAGPYMNTANITSSVPDPDTGNNSASVTPIPVTASMSILKSVGTPTTALGLLPAATDAGDTISYSFTVTNTGTSTLTNVVPVDPGPLFNALPRTGTMSSFVPSSATLAPGNSQIFTASYVLSALDVHRSVGLGNVVTNIADASATTIEGNLINAAATSSQSTSINAVSAMEIDKEYVLVDLPGGTAGVAELNEQITYTYTVRNTGNTRIDSAFISDMHDSLVPNLGPAQIRNEVLISDGPLASAGTPILSSDSTNDGYWDTLQTGAVIRFNYLHTVTQDEIDRNN